MYTIIEILMEIYLSNLIFRENRNGPYGPYEPLFWNISSKKWPQNRVFDKNTFFDKWPCPKF